MSFYVVKVLKRKFCKLSLLIFKEDDDRESNLSAADEFYLRKQAEIKVTRLQKNCAVFRSRARAL